MAEHEAKLRVSGGQPTQDLNALLGQTSSVAPASAVVPPALSTTTFASPYWRSVGLIAAITVSLLFWGALIGLVSLVSR